MARYISCDGCGRQVEDSEANRREFSGVHITKLTSGSPVLKVWELCGICTNHVQSIIARLPSIAKES